MSDIEQAQTVATSDATTPASTTTAQDVAEVYETAKEAIVEAVQSAVETIQEAHLDEKANQAIERVNEAIDQTGLPQKVQEVADAVSDKIEEAHIAEKIQQVYDDAVKAVEDTGIPAQAEHIKEVIQEKIEESHIKENIEHAVEVVQQKIEESHIKENVAQAVEVVKEKLEEAVEAVKEKTVHSVYDREPEPKKSEVTEEEKAKNELKQSRGRSNSKLGSMIGMFEKKVEDINNTLTPGVNELAKPPTPRGSTTPRKLGSQSPRVNDSAPAPVKESPKVKESPRAEIAKESPRADIAKESPRGEIAKESPRLARTNSGGKLGNMIGMFEKKVEDLNSTLTPGVNDLAPKPPKAAPVITRKNSFGKKPEEEKKPEEKKFKFDVKVSNMTSEKKNTELLKSAAKEEAWEGRRKSNADEDEEPKPRKNSLGGLKEKFENQAEEPVK
ncbi:laminin subunit beta-1 [Acrasis kona]|uniref:Laminin subunit beta-1 n=1 Tax=Acrasis kona TaxID=1008807 RepID=A0AAW2YY72_9EUKA